MIRGSELQDFLRCRKRWDYRWNQNLVPKKPNGKLLFGTLFHKFLEVWYSTGSLVQAGLAADTLLQETDMSGMDEIEYNDLVEMFVKVKHNYFETYKSDLDDWEVIATELTFAIPLDDEISYTGTIDLIVRDKEGRVWFLDHKTTQSIEKYDKNSDMDRQISRYWWALQQLQLGNGDLLTIDRQEGHTYSSPVEETKFYDVIEQLEIGGFIYNIILKDYPVPPKVLKSGKLSKDKAQKTTAKMYFDALMENNLYTVNPKTQMIELGEYQEFVDYLSEHPHEFFRRVRVNRTQQEIDASIEELYATTMDTQITRNKLSNGFFVNPIYRNITSDCSWDCAFKDICVASMDGSDVDYLVESLFTREEIDN